MKAKKPVMSLLKARKQTIRLILSAGSVAVLLISLWVAEPARTYAQGLSPQELVSAWVSSLDAHDVDGALALLDDDPYLIFSSPEDAAISEYEGKDQVKQVLQSWILADTRVQLKGSPALVNGTLTWTEVHSTQAQGGSGTALLEYNVDALVQNGKLRSLLYTPSGGIRSPAGMPRTGTQTYGLYQVLLAVASLMVAGGLFIRFRIHLSVYWGMRRPRNQADCEA